MFFINQEDSDQPIAVVKVSDLSFGKMENLNARSSVQTLVLNGNPREGGKNNV